MTSMLRWRAALGGAVTVVALTALAAFSPAKAITVNVSATDDALATVMVTLAPGKYKVTPIGVADGGLYDAWQYAVGEWTNRYIVLNDYIQLLEPIPPGAAGIDNTPVPPPLPALPKGYLADSGGAPFADGLSALAAAITTYFYLPAGAASYDVYFVNLDGGAREDNLGGNSLRVEAVPLPAALPLFASGLAVMGLVGRRRRRQPA